MKSLDILTAMALPASAMVDQRVPKSLLSENGAANAADRRLIKEGTERLYWYAALKPGSVGVPEFQDTTRTYQEIAVVGLILRPAVKASRLIELTHRAIPYPVVLIVEDGDVLSLSLAHKRASRAEHETTVLDGDVITVTLDGFFSKDQLYSFTALLALSRQPRTSLFDLYQGWIDTVLALQAARITGVLAPSRDLDHAAIRRDALRECFVLESEIAVLRSTATKTTQLARRAEINIELQRLQAAYIASSAKL